ncbi:hypothetical protein ANO11243_061610 [Dothideomycetidae sp. 11243]|nr:hypothetical protein ANO11243_061610 [fungal sp. No.11243]
MPLLFEVRSWGPKSGITWGHIRPFLNGATIRSEDLQEIRHRMERHIPGLVLDIMKQKSSWDLHTHPDTYWMIFRDPNVITSNLPGKVDRARERNSIASQRLRDMQSWAQGLAPGVPWEPLDPRYDCSRPPSPGYYEGPRAGYHPRGSSRRSTVPSQAGGAPQPPNTAATDGHKPSTPLYFYTDPPPAPGTPGSEYHCSLQVFQGNAPK